MNKQADSLADALFLLLNALDGRHLTQGDINEARSVLTEYETKRNELTTQASQERQEPVAWMFDRRYGSGLSFTKPKEYEDEDGNIIHPKPLYAAPQVQVHQGVGVWDGKSSLRQLTARAEAAEDELKRLKAAPPQAPQEGRVSVPVEPTAAMIEAANKFGPVMKHVWTAMIAAAPKEE